MVVDAIEAVSDTMDLSLVGVKKVAGGSVTESFLVKGVAFKRTFSYAGAVCPSRAPRAVTSRQPAHTYARV